ncbi:uncharacterized protein Rtnl1 isoform X2 [Diabrotica undecimpunctata]|uniref:uncharacterized protein Rtnl1 isoform X2 n=1 Tax=Diabrotica undecimpunctata TaxID=50387 RepID=UPI003B63BAA1
MEQHKDIEQGAFNIKREVDSVDDFEHLGHDSSPLQDLLGLQQDKEVTAPETVHEINNTPKTAVSHQAGASNLIHSLQNPLIPEKMNRNLLEDDFLDRGEGKEKLDQFLQDAALPPATSVFDHGNNKLFSANLIEAEKFIEPEKKEVDHFLDFEQEHPEPVKPKETVKHEIFEDAFKSDVPPLVPEISKEPIVPVQPAPPKPQPEKIIPSAPATVLAPEKKTEPEKLVKKVEEKPEKIIKKVEEKPVVTPAKIAPTDAAAIFCKMGLVESLIYWRDPKKSGPVFGGVLVVLLALTYFSLISVAAYVSLIALAVTLAFRIYKSIVQAVQKTGDGHPFKEYLELDISLPQEKVKQITEVAIAHVNAAIVELRRLFLVEDLVDSIKFAVLLWTLTYVGAWFNGMTLIILAWVALFTLPKVYEINKTQIDANLEIVRTKLAEITSKIKAQIPMGKKAEEKKEQ